MVGAAEAIGALRLGVASFPDPEAMTVLPLPDRTIGSIRFFRVQPSRLSSEHAAIVAVQDSVLLALGGLEYPDARAFVHLLTTREPHGLGAKVRLLVGVLAPDGSFGTPAQRRAASEPTGGLAECSRAIPVNRCPAFVVDSSQADVIAVRVRATAASSDGAAPMVYSFIFSREEELLAWSVDLPSSGMPVHVH